MSNIYLWLNNNVMPRDCDIRNNTSTQSQMPNAAWAWEYLRRNEDYINDWNSGKFRRPDRVELKTGGILYRENGKCRLAKKWGLLSMLDPSLDAVRANVFWQPRYLTSAIPISLSPVCLTSAPMAQI